MQFVNDIRLLILIAAANTAPLVAKSFLGVRFAYPIDNGMMMQDGQPVFGSSKTIRGMLSAIAATTALAPLLGLAASFGFLIGASAMVGDLCSSFIKRRLGLKASSRATGLDQIPESLLPTLLGGRILALTAADMVAITAIFLVGEIVLSRILFRLHLRDRPY
jgi:CDP-2,3-bis-(O-geranylgeranyl)-sn-glycerol synthase